MGDADSAVIMPLTLVLDRGMNVVVNLSNVSETKVTPVQEI